jgi:hypothetical protein
MRAHPSQEDAVTWPQILAALVLTPALVLAAPPPSDPWKDVRLLFGEWTGEGTGQPGEATAACFTFALDLGDQVAVRKSHAEYAPKPGEKREIIVVERHSGFARRLADAVRS